MCTYIHYSLMMMSALFCISGCAGSRPDFPAPVEPYAAGSVRSVSGTFQTSNGEYAAEYYTVTVPENRNSDSSRLIHLPVIRIFSTNKTGAVPVFGLTGGPGVSNLKWKPFDSLLMKHDFIMVGYRGVDGETTLDCPEVEEAMKSDDDLLSENALRKLGDAWTADANHLKEKGIDLNGYTIKEVIADVDDVRKMFGYSRIDLLSESYGTRVAYFYGKIHPSSTHRSVMIGVNPPGRFVWDPATIDSQLRYYSGLWSKDSVMSQRSPDLYETMKKVTLDLPERWLMFPINPGKVRTVTFAMLFHRKTAAMVFDAYRAAEQGDNSGLALMSLASDYVLPPMFTWGDLASKAVSVDLDTARNYVDGMEDRTTALGSPLSKLLWGSLSYGRWPTMRVPEEYCTIERSNVETLLLSGSVDFSTPSENAAAELLPFLPNGKQVVLKEYGHVADIWNVEPAAVQKIVAEYFDSGTVDQAVVPSAPMDFSVAVGFPAISKIALTTVTILSAALLYGVYGWLK
jgi:pimeloyl-ACP methyl ester carboxylesterase